MRNGIVIPAYQPSEVLIDLISALSASLLRAGETGHIIIIDDGSDSPESLLVFDALMLREDIHLIRHEHNLGKGAALKTGIAYAAETELDWVVTADADGQHDADDIVLVLQRAKQTQGYVIGTRDFGGEVPARSRLGNAVTSRLVRLMLRRKISDTQSGLRAFPARFFHRLLTIRSTGYEYEFQALLDIAKVEKLYHQPIKTIYEPGNPTSHFRPIQDSALIYIVLLRYSAFTAAISFLDLLGFYILAKFISPAAAFPMIRGVTVIIYFVLLRKFVFKAQHHLIRQIILFILLVLANLILVGNAIYHLEKYLAVNPLVIYLGSTLTFFAFNFVVQRYVIFKD